MKSKHSPTLLVRLISLVLAVFALSAFFGIQARPAFAESPSYVRILHASPDIATADVFLDGKTVLSNFAFAVATGYVTIPAGPHKVQVALIGKGPGAAAITQTLSVQAGVAYTVAAIGTKATGLSLETFIDDNQLVTGMAKVRVYHLSPGAGTVNVSTGEKTVITGLAYQQASDYVTISPGSYTFTVTATQPAATLTVPATLKANTVTSIFAVGVINGTPKFQPVTEQVPALPGVPKTGSDPNANAVPGSVQPLTPWLFGSLALIVIGVSVLTRRTSLASKKAKMHSGR